MCSFDKLHEVSVISAKIIIKAVTQHIGYFNDFFRVNLFVCAINLCVCVCACVHVCLRA